MQLIAGSKSGDAFFNQLDRGYLTCLAIIHQ